MLAAKYALERPAGLGGMAELWVATNRATGGEICMKVFVPAEGADAEESALRFRREAHASARLAHRAIVRVFDLLELDREGNATSGSWVDPGARAPHAYAIVMELLAGETLGDRLSRESPLPLATALDLMLDIVSALSHAHREGVVHRDIKPDNVFLAQDPDGHIAPKVLDFGISKLANAETITLDGVLLGTPDFMSPEQARGARKIDARSDVFSAAVLFYVMLTGRHPYLDEGEHDFATTIAAILRADLAPAPEIPTAIDAVLRQALARDPALRFADASELGAALRRAAGRRPAESSPSLPRLATPASVIAPRGLGAAPGSHAKRRSLGLIIVGSTLVVAVVIVVAAFVRRPAMPSFTPAAPPPSVTAAAATSVTAAASAAPAPAPPSARPKTSSPRAPAK